ncbi:MAG: PH domain-containing protein [Aliifodinibius sp.]|nr:PH domain-containing protein [Fodinibius sp.]NIV13608.1 PH domain-containing protein [Fodinibius sp.]NIY27353.1 PH domain-containing protein [Fodinibius sp.]
MAPKPKVLQKAEFNPKIKKYLLIYGVLISIVTIVGIPLLPIYLVVAPILINKYFDRLSAELTTRALRFEKGVLFHVERTIPLDKIQDLTFKEGPLLKYFGLSILKVETAGGSGQGQADLTLIGIRDASNFRSRVLEQRDNVTDNKYSSSTSETEESTLAVLKEIRDSLKSIDQKMNSK